MFVLLDCNIPIEIVSVFILWGSTKEFEGFLKYKGDAFKPIWKDLCKIFFEF